MNISFLPRGSRRLTLLPIQAPLIASVVSSCTGAISNDFDVALDADPHTRPVSASVIIALLWSAQLVSLGSSLTAVAGLALDAGYHDHRQSLVTRISSVFKPWISQRHSPSAAQDDSLAHNLHAALEVPRGPSPIMSDAHRRMHNHVSFSAAVVSARVGFLAALYCACSEVIS